MLSYYLKYLIKTVKQFIKGKIFMINYSNNHFFKYYYYKQKKYQYSAFNIYLISNYENLYLNKSKSSIKILILNKLHKNTKKIIENSTNNFYKNINDIKNFINNKSYNNIKYTKKTKSKLNYVIFYIKNNSILRKIKVHNYNKLKISKYILFNSFKHQIGLPINYLSIKNSLNIIIEWYLYHGYKWIKVKYSYINNEIQLHIYEGVIDEIIFSNNYNKFFDKKKYKILKVNNLIKQELSFFTYKPVTINNLELIIKEIKKKYSIQELTYQLKYKSEKLILIIEYDLKYKNIVQFKKNIIIKNFKKKLIFFKLYLFNIRNNHFFKFKYTRISYLYNNLSFFIITSLNKSNIYPFTLKNILNRQIIKLYLKRINNYSLKLFIYFEHFLINKLIYSNDINNFYLLPKYKNFEYIKMNTYTNIINLIKIEVNIKFQISKKLALIKKIINEYKYCYEKSCLLKNYIQNFKYANINKLKKIIKIKQTYILNLTLKSIYNYPSFIPEQNNQGENKISIDYCQIIYLNMTKLHIFHKFKNYINIIKLKYYKCYKFPEIFYKYNSLNIYVNIYKINGYISKYLLLKQYYLNTYGNILINIEYKFYAVKENYIYLFINCIPKLKYNIHNIQYLYNINDYKNTNIKSGIGIELKIPIKYIPNIRLEIYTKNYKKFLFYFYKTSLLYQ